jgi:hypothetical protein
VRLTLKLHCIEDRPWFLWCRNSGDENISQL